MAGARTSSLSSGTAREATRGQRAIPLCLCFLWLGMPWQLSECRVGSSFPAQLTGDAGAVLGQGMWERLFLGHPESCWQPRGWGGSAERAVPGPVM